MNESSRMPGKTATALQLRRICNGAVVVFHVFSLLVSATLVSELCHAAPAEPVVSNSTISAEDLYERIAPCVVTLIARDEDGNRISSGSGFFVDDALVAARYPFHKLEREIAAQRVGQEVPKQGGYVLTNYHVIRAAVNADVMMNNGDKGYALTILADSKNDDLALLSVGVSTSKPPSGIPLAPADPRILSTVYAIGSPKGLRGSASDGRVSSYQDLAVGRRWLQFSAPISPGSSGGPLLSPTGMVVGINTESLRDAQNINFAVPVSIIRTFFENSQFRLRSISADASIRFQERSAFSELDAAAKRSNFSAAEQTALANLSASWKKLRWSKEISTCEEVISAVAETQKSIPPDYKYLAFYLSGIAHAKAANSQRLVPPHVSSSIGRSAAADRKDSHVLAAVEQLNSASRLKLDFAPCWNTLAWEYLQLDRSQEALTAADVLVTAAPRCSNAYASRANCYLKLGLYDLAILDRRLAIDLSPLTAEKYLELGQTLVAAGRDGEAIEPLEKSLELAAQDDDFTAAYAGLTFENMKQFDKAIAAYQKARELGWPKERCDAAIIECRQKKNESK